MTMLPRNDLTKPGNAVRDWLKAVSILALRTTTNTRSAVSWMYATCSIALCFSSPLLNVYSGTSIFDAGRRIALFLMHFPFLKSCLEAGDVRLNVVAQRLVILIHSPKVSKT